MTQDTETEDSGGGLIGAGRVAVITGAASGIGRAMAELFASEGSTVVVADLDADGAGAVAREITDRGGSADAVQVDVSDPVSVEALAAFTRDRFGGVDVLCNNAGVSTFNLIQDQTLDDWKWVLSVNLWGVVHGVHSFLPVMREQGRPAHIVNTASVAGLLSGVAFIGPYSATKVAVVSISETMSQEFAIAGLPIGVSVLCPSATETHVMESDRNRPDYLGSETRTEMAESVRLAIKGQFTGPDGQPPSRVARRVLEAVRAGEFWIITHPSERPAMETRVAGIMDAYPQPG
jgi:NAD(P)-dependent dehydrogenase (short-subunit alcohol dehydrogenase family)